MITLTYKYFTLFYFALLYIFGNSHISLNSDSHLLLYFKKIVQFLLASDQLQYFLFHLYRKWQELGSSEDVRIEGVISNWGIELYEHRGPTFLLLLVAMDGVEIFGIKVQHLRTAFLPILTLLLTIITLRDLPDFVHFM